MALRVTLAAAAVTTLVCAPAAWADTFMLGGTGTVGAPTQRAMAFLINDRIVEPDTLGDPTNSDGGLMAKLPGWYLPVLDFSFTPPAVDTPYRDLEQGPQPGVRRTRAPESNIRETPDSSSRWSRRD